MIEGYNCPVLVAFACFSIAGCVIPEATDCPCTDVLLDEAQSQGSDENSEEEVIPAVPSQQDLPYRLIIDPSRPLPEVLSRGIPSEGELFGSEAIAHEGIWYYVLPNNRPRQANYAHPDVVEVLERSGQDVEAQYPGSRIALGDASLENGGDIRLHRSHENGLDVDIPFFIVDPEGVMLHTQAFHRFDNAVPRSGIAFDVERNWLLVELLLSQEVLAVQWIFISEPLKALILQHAREIGVSELLLERARRVLWEPSDSSPHDDHFHVRFYCPSTDQLEGCRHFGPVWDGLSVIPVEFGVRTNQLLEGMEDADEEIRKGVVEYLVHMGAAGAGPSLAEYLPAETPHVQLSILSAIRQFKTEGVGELVLGLVNADGPLEVKMAALLTAQSVPVQEGAYLLMGVIGDGSGQNLSDLTLEAARVLREMLPSDQLEGLLAGLQMQEGETWSVIAETFSRITGEYRDVNWSTLTPHQRREFTETWIGWYESNHSESRLEWLWGALKDGGLPLPETVGDERGIMILIESLDSRSSRYFHVQELLSEMTGEVSPPGSWSVDRQREYWREMTAPAY